jgi:serine phosphatase RsbU (regulator of sigma subunit)
MNEYDLTQIPLFSSLPPSEIEFLTEVLRPITLDPGEVLFSEGEPGDKFYVITDGQVEVVKSIGTADEQILDSRRPGDFFGEMSLLIPDRLRTASVRACSPVQMMELSSTDFDRLLQRRPSLALELVRELSLRLRDSDNAMIHDLTEKNRELAQAYQELQAAQVQLVEKEKLEHELNLAHNIQQSILPDNLALMEGFDFGARMVPARAVGGDLYDFIQLDQDTVGISIGDVSDKGVPAAIFMALYCSLLRAEALHVSSPADVLRRVNRHLLDLNEARMFVTALYGVLNRKTCEFSYARAGHHIPILFDDCGKETPINRDHGQLLGFFPDPDLDVQTVVIPQGSTLLLYTDGMFDLMDKNDKSYGEERLRGMACAHQGSSAQDICEKIIAELKSYQGESPQFDDMALVAIQCVCRSE